MYVLQEHIYLYSEFCWVLTTYQITMLNILHKFSLLALIKQCDVFYPPFQIIKNWDLQSAQFHNCMQSNRVVRSDMWFQSSKPFIFYFAPPLYLAICSAIIRYLKNVFQWTVLFDREVSSLLLDFMYLLLSRYLWGVYVTGSRTWPTCYTYLLFLP